VVAVVLFVAASGMVTPLPVYARATLVVDADGHATATDCNAGRAAFRSIQAAVNAAAAGDEIVVCPGTYAEQVEITKNNLTLRGIGQGVAVLRPDAVPPTIKNLITGAFIGPILMVSGATGVTVARLTIDGSGADGGAAILTCREAGFYVGLYYRNGSGTVDSVHVTNVMSATRCSNAIRAERGDGVVANLLVNNNTFDNYADGLVCVGQGISCTVTGNTFRGRGPVNDYIQGGILVFAAATAAITGNVITDHFYTPAKGLSEEAVGILLINATPDTNPHLLRDNTFINNQHDVQRSSTAQAG
jgi:hypothetical protein